MSAFTLSVFNEFAASEAQLAAIATIPNLTLDRAAEPSTQNKLTDEEQVVLRTNAKLFFDHELLSVADVDALVAQLSSEGCGLEVVHRKPITSAGYPIQGRVILKLKV